MHVALLEAWSRTAPAPPSDVAQDEEELWMQKDDVASAWAVAALTGAALTLLIVLALIG